NIIQKVKYTVESLTGLNVSKVIVNVQGIRV
ncbi:MAG: Asp23/Gls24 family envelope stress response protein, partial [Clostridium sp.]